MEYAGEATEIYVPQGTLSTAPERAPDKHLSFEERVGWFSLNDALPRIEGKP